ncbi:MULTISPECIES: helix-turn-helix domain-containing protein [unclassified Streptomyces]|uniref:helix-turn-helix domain-containing protein n=1 Tax=unclassified Streptomyces TaxID=2593676 RepID=UPI002E188C43|nr:MULTISPECIES: helix-turn-helix domain-containing protein [unclassified Streptomyces]
MAVRKDMRKVTDEERAEIIRLHGQNVGRNEIARRIGRAQRTVSIVCAEEGLVFDISMTEDATRHRVAQLAALRAETAVDLHVDALRLSQQMWEPSVVYNFGGKDNTFRQHAVEELSAMDKRSLMAAAGMALEKSMKLVPPADDSGAEDARSMLGQLMVGLKAAYDQAAEEGLSEEAEGESP